MPRGRLDLKKRFILLVLAIFVAIGLLTVMVFDNAIDRLTRQLGEEFVSQYADKEKNYIQGLIDRELALSLRMVDSPLFKHWLRHEEDPALRAQALAEMESYRHLFRDHNVFIASNLTRHYYFNNPAGEFTGREMGHVLDPALKVDRWFFTTVAKVEEFDLNVDYDPVAGGDIKLWVNAVIKDRGETIAVAGTGLELGQFLKTIMGRLSPGITLILFNDNGAILAHPDRERIDENTLSKSQAEHKSVFPMVTDAQELARLREAMARVREHPERHEALRLRLEGQESMAAVVFMPAIDRYLLVTSDIAQFVGDGRFTPLATVLGGAMLVLLVSITLLLNHQVINPLSLLNQAVQRMAKGDYRPLDLPPRKDEIGALGSAFDHMVATVRQHTENLDGLVKTRTRDLDQANQELTAIHEELFASIEYARLLQASILPKPHLLAERLAGHFLLWRPRELVGGDFIWYHAGNDGVLLAVVDCTGHGVPGALMTMTANAVLNHIASDKQRHDPATILAIANRILRETLHADQHALAMDNGLDMALCHWRPGEDHLTFAGARLGLVRVDAEGVTEWRGDNHSLGYHRSDPAFVFTSHRVALTPGACFYLATDGVMDQSGGDKGFGFGKKRLYDTLAALAPLPLEEQGPRLQEILLRYQAHHPQRDDWTVLGFRPARDNPSLGSS